MNIFLKFKLLKLRHQVKKSVKQQRNRPLDINEILSRQNSDNVVVDAYEYFMRKCNWGNISCFNSTVQDFLAAVEYDGFVGNGGVSVFLESSSANDIGKTIRALNKVGCTSAANILLDAAKLSEGSMVPHDPKERSKALCDITKTFLDDLDKKSFEIDIASYCYAYLQKHKSAFSETID